MNIFKITYLSYSVIIGNNGMAPFTSAHDKDHLRAYIVQTGYGIVVVLSVPAMTNGFKYRSN